MKTKITKENTGKFTKGFSPWNKGKHPEYMQGKNHPELRRDINNLITLCNECHNKTKRKEKKYEELFINIIKLKNE